MFCFTNVLIQSGDLIQTRDLTTVRIKALLTLLPVFWILLLRPLHWLLQWSLQQFLHSYLDVILHSYLALHYLTSFLFSTHHSGMILESFCFVIRSLSHYFTLILKHLNSNVGCFFIHHWVQIFLLFFLNRVDSWQAFSITFLHFIPSFDFDLAILIFQQLSTYQVR